MEPKLRVIQRVMRDLLQLFWYSLLQNTLKKKVVGKNKGSWINPPEHADIERGIQDVFERSGEVKNEGTHNADKSTVEEVRKKILDTFSEPGIELGMMRVYQNQN